MLVTKNVLSVPTGFYQREYFCHIYMELAFINFPTHFHVLKASHINYTCTSAAKPRAQVHCHEEDPKKCDMGKNRPHGEEVEESFS